MQTVALAVYLIIIANLFFEKDKKRMKKKTEERLYSKDMNDVVHAERQRKKICGKNMTVLDT